MNSKVEQNTVGTGTPCQQANRKTTVHESAIKHVTGKAIYVDDQPEPRGLLHAATGWSDATCCGKILDMDLSAVYSAPGVVAVITLDDVPGHKDIGPVFPGDPVLADGEILFHGQPIFAVAADTDENARRAATLARIVVEETSPLLDPKAAVDEARLVRPTHSMHCRNQAGEDANTVLAGAQQDTQQRDAQKIIEGAMHIGGQEHYYLEGQVSLASPTEDGGFFIRCSTQHPSEVQKLVAEVLAKPLSAVTVETRRMGGAFGGKETHAAQWACLAALLAHKTQQDVKFRLPRMADMLQTGKRHPFANSYRIAIDEHGRMLAADITVIGDCGCSPDLSDAIVDRAMFHADNAYYLPAADITGYRAFTNKVSQTAFRGFGGPQGMMIIERAMDDIAREVGKDPLTIRKLNLYGNGRSDHNHRYDGKRDITPYHQVVESRTLNRVIDELEACSHYWQRREAMTRYNQAQPRYKKGLALTPVKFGISFTVQHLNQAGALVHVYTDGSVQVNHGGTEMGQGLNTKVAQIVARVFGLDAASIQTTATRTDKVPNTSPTAASSGTDLNGQAAKNAAETIKQRLLNFLTERYGVIKSDIHFRENQVVIDGVPDPLTFAELAQQAYMARVSLSSTGFYRTPKIHYDRQQAKGRPFFYYATGAAVSEVLVDTLTGEYKVTRVDIVHDVGDSLNPAIDIGQIEGGFIQGMGWLTTEELSWSESGRLQTQGAATYKIPAAADTPAIFNVKLLENQPNEEATIYHSKAVGEPPFMLAISVWSALRDAVSSLNDYRHSPNLDTPATPERVYWAIQEAKSLAETRPLAKTKSPTGAEA